MTTMEEYDAFEKRMKEAYPKIFAKPFGGFAIDKGWWPIIETLCSNIQRHTDFWNKNHERFPVVEQVVVVQVKEKFGGLRFYYDGGDDQIRGMVTMAESWADSVCEECGKPGKLRGGGWMKTLCDEHDAERQARYKERFKNDAT